MASAVRDSANGNGQLSCGHSVRPFLLAWIIFILSVSLRGCYGIPMFTFTIHPRSNTIEEGSNISFQCQIESDVDVKSVSSVWENRNKEILYPDKLIDVTTQVSSTGLITSILTMQNVGRELEDSYRCTVLLLLPNKNLQIASSEFGNLSVVYFPEEDDMNCHTPNGLTVKADDTVTISCEVTDCDVPLDMTWEQSNLIGLHHTVLFHDTCSLTWRVTVDQNLQNEMLYCIVTSSDFSGRSSNCSLGPYDVLYPPKVEVNPEHSEVMVPSLATSTSLYCLVDSNPPVLSFKWSCSPAGFIPVCESTEQNITIPLSQIGMRNISVNITCTATNKIGTSSNISKFAVSSPLGGSGDECTSPNLRNISVGQKEIYLLYFHTGQLYHFACAFIEKNGTSSSFRWYLNGNPVRGRNRTQIRPFLPWLRMDFLDLRSDTLFARDTPIVTCEIFNETLARATSCTFTSKFDPTTPSIPDFTSSQPSVSSSVSLRTHQEDSDVKNSASSKPTENSSLDFWDIFWMLLIAVTVGFVLVMCSISLVLIVQRASRRGRMPFNRPSDTIQLTNLQQGIFPNQKSADADEPVYELPRDCKIRKKQSCKPLPPRPKHEVCELKKLKDDGEPEGSCSDAYSGIYEDSSNGDDENRGSIVSSSETSSATQYREYAECEGDIGFLHYDNHQVIESFTGKRQSSYYWNRSTTLKDAYERDVEERVKMFASEGSLRNIQRIYLE